jgi:dipeptidase D
MVCEKEPGVVHDFFKDPISLARDGDRVFARGTTLGADNAIGAAAALALMTEPGIEHGPLELVFTVEEETGLHGAVAFNPALMSATMLINLDSEDSKTLTVGCAGGSAVEITLVPDAEPAPKGWAAHRLVLGGARGGHSGVNIHERRCNAIKLLVHGLRALTEAGVELRLVALEGGSAHNVIPRDAQAVFVVPPEAAADVTTLVERFSAQLLHEWASDEPELRVELHPATVPPEVLSPKSATRLLELLHDLPHGVLAMSRHFEGKVETSANLAKVAATPDSARIVASVRSFSAASESEVRERIARLGSQAGGSVVVEMGYPGWEPDPESQLLKVAREQFELVNGKPPIVEVLHAGLECGVLVAKKPGMEAISFGPLIGSAHSPSEFVTVSTVDAMWRLLVGLVAALRRG